MASKTDVIRGFKKQTGKHQRGSVGRGGQTNIFYERQVLYSFGYHFPLAIRYHSEQEIPEESTGFGCGVQFLINGDKYSNSTTSHQNEAIGMLKPNVQVPFSALEEAWNWAAMRDSGYAVAEEKWKALRPVHVLGENRVATNEEYAEMSQKQTDYGRSEEYLDAYNKFETMRVRGASSLVRDLLCEDSGFRIVAFSKDTWTHSFKRADGTWTQEYNGDEIPEEFKHIALWGRPSRYAVDQEQHVKSTHRLGGVLFSIRGTRFLSSFDALDRSNYFLCHIPGEVDTIEEAYEALKPSEVKFCEKAGATILRQGDWFFIPANEPQAEMRKWLEQQAKGEVKQFRLGGTSGTHVVSRKRGEEGARMQLVAGTVKHSPTDGRSPEHKRLKLGTGKSWWIPVKNTSEAGWGAKGNVD